MKNVKGGKVIRGLTSEDAKEYCDVVSFNLGSFVSLCPRHRAARTRRWRYVTSRCRLAARRHHA